MSLQKTKTSSLPTSAQVRSGAEFDPRDDKWIVYDLSQNSRINFARLRGYASASLIESSKHVLLWYMVNLSTPHANTLFDRFCALLRFAGGKQTVDTVTAEIILAYRSTLSRYNEWYLGSLRGFFRKWYDLQVPGIDDAVVKALDEMRLHGNMKGVAVRTSDPHRGPLTDIEFQAAIAAINSSFSDGYLNTEDYLLAWLTIALGSRPAQLAALKLSDFRVVEASDGSTSYILSVPRAKQRGGLHRAEFKDRRIICEIGQLIEIHKASVIGKIPFKQDNVILPMFVSRLSTDQPDGFAFHCTGVELTQRVRAIFDSLCVISERTGEAIKISPRRLRYTKGTRAAAEGASELVIAELLDHSDTQNVGVYVEAVPEIVERIDRAMAIHLAPLAQAFAGQLIENEDGAVRGDDPRSRVVSPNNLDNPVGNCGSHGYCGAAAPIACYTCQNFQPWLDGPHEEVLTSLIAERDRVLEQTGDLAIAAINDRLILAVAQVVDLCEGRKQA